MSETIVLPAASYDTLELSAYVFGGIGQPAVYDYASDIPICIHAHATYACGEYGFGSPLSTELYRLGIKGFISDAAVRAINARKGHDSDARVSWKEYTRELNIVRGEK